MENGYLEFLDDENSFVPSGLPILTGYMIKRGRWVPTWHRRYFELHPDRLLYFADDSKLNQKGAYVFNAATLCSNSSTRNFCFCLHLPGSYNRHDVLYLATYNMEQKDNWMGTILSTLSLLKVVDSSKLHPSVLDSLTEEELIRLQEEADEVFVPRPRLYIKLIRVRGLNRDDSKYAQIRIGSSSIRSTSKQTSEWNETFNFEFDLSMRYATLEIWTEEGLAQDTLLSVTDIPLLHLKSSVPFRQWYPLCKKTQASPAALGEVEVEISYSQDPSKNEALLSFFDTVKMMPNMRLTVSDDETYLQEPSFFDTFPPTQSEIIEDIYSTVALTSLIDDEVVFCFGTLIISNYRLMFLQNNRLSTDESPVYGASSMFFYISIGDITTCTTVKQHDDYVGSIVDIIRVKTNDLRVFNFAFVEEQIDGQAKFWKELKMPQGVSQIKLPISASSETSLEMNMFGFQRGSFGDGRLQEAYDKAYSVSPGNFAYYDGTDSFEGPAAQRISMRLKNWILNRSALKTLMFNAQYSIIASIVGASIEEDPRIRRITGIFPEEKSIICTRFVDSWGIYVPVEEFGRMGVPNDKWRLCYFNSGYEQIKTYPEILVVPAAATDEVVSGSMRFRSRGRLPALSYLSKKNGCSLTRCSQPLVGLTLNRSEEDEMLLRLINRTIDSSKPLIIADARPKLNAQANQAAGKGFEFERNYENSEVVFLGIPNIHVIRKSHEAIMALFASKSTDSANFLKEVDASGWLEYIRRILDSSVKIAHWNLIDGCNVLVHCSDGWDRTAQLTSLAMLMLDPYYRTLKGFMILIEQEWFSFGHKFVDRNGWSSKGWKDDDRSPIFEQFLHCVYQMYQQQPSAFEFNEKLLRFIAENTYNGWFGNFVANCEEERKFLIQSSFSIWLYVEHNKHLFVASSYNPDLEVFIPAVSAKHIIVWQNRFTGWNNTIWRFSWSQTGREASAESSWFETDSIPNCSSCKLSFGLFRYRHVCTSCGLVFCKRCLGETNTCQYCSVLESSSGDTKDVTGHNLIITEEEENEDD